MIEFICAKRLEGRIPEPRPAKDFIPDWYKALRPTIEDESMNTIKRCMPFFDMLTTGWIIPLAADTGVEVQLQGTEVRVYAAKDLAPGELIPTMNFHGAEQVKGHPHAPRHPCKFLNHWIIKTPPGVSCLFMQPTCQDHNKWALVPAIVDTDTYKSTINFPFFPLVDEKYIIPKGMPIVQVIPFDRKVAAMTSEIRVNTMDEIIAHRATVTRTTDGDLKRSFYRKDIRDKRK